MQEYRIGDSPTGTEKNSIFSEIASFFTSARTTIFLLFILAAGSVLGTVIPQNAEIGSVSSFQQRLVVILDLNNLYRSWWFTALLVLLSLNLMGCLLKRLPSIPAEWKGESKKATFTVNLSDARSPLELKEILTPALRGIMGGSPRSGGQDGSNLTWVKDRIYLLGFPFIHIAIIVILLGGVIGLLYGYRGHALIKEGDSASEFTLQSGEPRSLPFSIAVDSFSLTRYPSGEPKEFRSDVRLLENGKEALQGSILVNHPLTYRGISLYQSDYRVLGVKEVNFNLTDGSGETKPFSMNPYAAKILPGTDYEVRLLKLDPGGMKRGAGVEISVQQPGKEPQTFKIFKNDTGPVKVGDVALRFLDYAPLYATGLQIGYDPGTVVVWTGCSLLVLGFFLTLFTNHRRVTVRLKTEKHGTRIQISGRSRRMRKEFRELVEKSVRGALGTSDDQTYKVSN
jgi:cytochrome c biogenesis protein